MVLPLTENNEIYLISQYRDSFHEVIIELIAGNMDESKSPLDNAKRELREEAGLIANTWKQLATFHMSAKLIGELYIFVATDLEETERNLDDDEQIEVLKLPLEQAVEKVEKGEIRVSSNVASILLLNKMRSEGKI